MVLKTMCTPFCKLFVSIHIYHQICRLNRIFKGAAFQRFICLFVTGRAKGTFMSSVVMIGKLGMQICSEYAKNDRNQATSHLEIVWYN